MMHYFNVTLVANYKHTYNFKVLGESLEEVENAINRKWEDKTFHEIAHEYKNLSWTEEYEDDCYEIKDLETKQSCTGES